VGISCFPTVFLAFNKTCVYIYVRPAATTPYNPVDQTYQYSSFVTKRCHEWKFIIKPVSVGFVNHIDESLIEISRKGMELSASHSIVNFKDGCRLLVSSNFWSIDSDLILRRTSSIYRENNLASSLLVSSNLLNHPLAMWCWRATHCQTIYLSIMTFFRQHQNVTAWDCKQFSECFFVYTFRELITISRACTVM